MADYYKNAIEEMLEELNDDDLAFFCTLMERMLSGKCKCQN